MRAIPSDISTLEALRMPPVVSEFANLSRGLVLVTGPTGSGKSTTLASLIDLINRTRASHIVTIEDPIEFTHAHKESIVNQREVGIDTLSFAAACGTRCGRIRTSSWLGSSVTSRPYRLP